MTEQPFALGVHFLQKMSTFDDWVPQDYLSEYFNQVQEDERHVIRYFVEQMRGTEVGPVLCFGCGPGLNHVFLTAPHMTEIVLADYLAGNLAELEKWQRGTSKTHDWTAFVRHTLACESGVEPDRAEIAKRMEAVRNGLTDLVLADAGLTDPMGDRYRGYFATVLSPFCADSATDSKDVWARYSRNIASLVRPGGLMLTAALRHCHRYRVGSRYFPSANIDESDLRAVLAQDFLPDSIQVETREVSEHEEQGYSSILLARSRKP
jgi:hypothetical protein